MPIDAQTLSELLEQELTSVSDARVVEQIRKILVPPSAVLRDWDYGQPGQQYLCWIVLNDAEHSGTAIGYCENGFGPRCPWGLLNCGDDPSNQSMGMDSGWFPNFMEAFFESSAATRLPIWRVFEVARDGNRTALTDEATWEATWNRIEQLRHTNPTSHYTCGHSI